MERDEASYRGRIEIVPSVSAQEYAGVGTAVGQGRKVVQPNSTCQQ